jgi:hypothetical protein
MVHLCHLLSAKSFQFRWFFPDFKPIRGIDCVASPDRGLMARRTGNPPVSRALVRRARLNYKFQRILLAKLLLAYAYLAEFCLLVVLIFESTTILNTVNYSSILSRFIEVILVMYMWKLTNVNRVYCRKAILIWIEYFWLLTRYFSSRNACEQTWLCIQKMANINKICEDLSYWYKYIYRQFICFIHECLYNWRFIDIQNI